MKTIIWLGTVLEEMREFPVEACREAGYQLYRIQSGKDPSDWKPMPGVGAGVREIRIMAGGQWRVIYLATRPEGVYVLHAFQKKTRKTSKRDIDLAKKRLRSISWK